MRASANNCRDDDGTDGIVRGHIALEAAVGGLHGLAGQGDLITIDTYHRLLQLNVPESEIETHRAN